MGDAADSLMTHDDRLIRDTEVAFVYGVSTRTVWRWAEIGRIPKPVVQRTNYTRWRKSEVMRHFRMIGQEEAAEAAS